MKRASRTFAARQRASLIAAYGLPARS